MNNQNEHDLQELKNEILRDIAPLIETSNFDPVQKFELLLSSARISDEPSRFRAAYNVIGQIESVDIKVNAMLDLLDAIDIATTQTPAISSRPPVEAEQPEQLESSEQSEQ